MKHAKKLTCLAALTMSALGATAHADVDDNYPWMWSAGGTYGEMSVMSRAYSGGYGHSGGLAISSSADVDYHVMVCGNSLHPGLGTVSPGIINSVGIEFTHAQGDLDIWVYSVGGEFLGSSTGTGNTETVNLASGNRGVVVLKVGGYQGATGSYGLALQCK